MSRVNSLQNLLKIVDDQSKSTTILNVDKFYKDTQILVLSDIAMSLAVIADKLTEDDHNENK